LGLRGAKSSYFIVYFGHGGIKSLYFIVHLGLEGTKRSYFIVYMLALPQRLKLPEFQVSDIGLKHAHFFLLKSLVRSLFGRSWGGLLCEVRHTCFYVVFCLVLSRMYIFIVFPSACDGKVKIRCRNAPKARILSYMLGARAPTARILSYVWGSRPPKARIFTYMSCPGV